MYSGWKVIAVGYKNKARALRREASWVWKCRFGHQLAARFSQHLLGRRFLKNFEVVEPSAAGYFCSGNTEELGVGVGPGWRRNGLNRP